MAEVSFCFPFCVQSHKYTFTSEPLCPKCQNCFKKPQKHETSHPSFNKQSQLSFFHLKHFYGGETICAPQICFLSVFNKDLCVLLQQLVTATGLWLNISTQRGLLTVIKTNKLLHSVARGFKREACTGAVTPNLNAERKKRKRKAKRKGPRGPCSPHSSQTAPPPSRPATIEDAQSHTSTSTPPSCSFFFFIFLSIHTESVFGLTTKR